MIPKSSVWYSFGLLTLKYPSTSPVVILCHIELAGILSHIPKLDLLLRDKELPRLYFLTSPI